jgi:hypothetical protein
MLSCLSRADQTWSCDLERERNREHIVWNSSDGTTFTPPPEWRIRMVETMSGRKQSFVGGTLELTGAPLRLATEDAR